MTPNLKQLVSGVLLAALSSVSVSALAQACPDKNYLYLPSFPAWGRV